jgi:hypothetical protein
MPSGSALHQGLVEHQEPGVPVEGLERVDARVKRQDLGREHPPRQAELPPGRHDRQNGGDHRDDPCAVLSQVSMADCPASS